MIIACMTNYREHDKVPHWEQLASTAAATQNLLLALQALGYATVWRTGPLANAAAVKTYFGLEGDNQVVGFVYIGTPGTKLPPRAPMLVDDFNDYRG